MSAVVLPNDVLKKEPLLEGPSFFLFRFPNLLHIFKLNLRSSCQKNSERRSTKSVTEISSLARSKIVNATIGL